MAIPGEHIKRHKLTNTLVLFSHESHAHCHHEQFDLDSNAFKDVRKIFDRQEFISSQAGLQESIITDF